MLREFLFLFFIFSLGASGRKVLVLLKTNYHFLDNLIFSFGIGCFIYSTLFFFLGISNFFSFKYFFIVQIILLLFFSSPVLIFKDLKNFFSISCKDLTLKIKVGLIIVAIIEFSLFLISFSPSFFWDELHYHLAAPEIFLSLNKISFLPYFPYANFPLGSEMLFAYFVSLNLEELAPQLHCLAGFFCLLTTFKISRLFLNQEIAISTLLFFISTTLFLHLSTIAYIDLFVLFGGLTSFYLILKYCQSQDKQYLFLAALFTAGTLSSKYSSLIYVLMNLITVFYYYYLNKQKFLLEKVKSNNFFLPLLKYFWGSIFLGSFWYLKNLILAGNPFYPFLYNVFGGKYLNSETSLRFTKEIAGFGGLGKNILDFF